MKQYEKYIETSLAGINEVPHHWKPIKLKFIGNLYSGLSGKSGDDFYNPENPLSRPYISFKNIAGNSKINPAQLDYVVINPDDIQNKVKKGDLFFLMSSENFEDIGKTAVLETELENTYLNSFCRGFRISDKNFDPSFLNYLLSSDLYRQLMSIEAKGFTRINIQVGKIQNFLIYAPFSIKEQRRIAEYLDHQTSIINELIKQKVKLIQLLKEKWQSIINEVVIKGLNPRSKMKDSGISWLGEMPENWSITKLKYIIDELESGVSVNSESIPIEIDSSEKAVLKTSCVFDYSFKPEENKKVVEEEIDRVKCPVRSNTIIISRMNTPDLVGASGYVEKDYPNLFLPDRLWQTVINESVEVDVEFISYILKSDIYRGVFSTIATGSSPSMKNITQSSFLDLPIPFPEIGEQKSIKEYLKLFDNRIINAIKILESSVDKLKEYHQSIITEAVTGKIDVREWQSHKQQVA
ncbi:MAG: restriction endonuclease subunit S [Niastella sp.]|nr:restriction endonuclease subunit S [Niastella sp.]